MAGVPNVATARMQLSVLKSISGTTVRQGRSRPTRPVRGASRIQPYRPVFAAGGQQGAIGREGHCLDRFAVVQGLVSQEARGWVPQPHRPLVNSGGND